MEFADSGTMKKLNDLRLSGSGFGKLPVCGYMVEAAQEGTDGVQTIGTTVYISGVSRVHKHTITCEHQISSEVDQKTKKVEKLSKWTLRKLVKGAFLSLIHI